MTQNISEAFDWLDIIATSCILTRKAMAQFNKMANIDASRSVIEAALNNMCKANQRATKLPRGEVFQFSENMQYFIMYILGALKSQIISMPMIIN